MPSSCTIRISAQEASTLAISSTAMFNISVPVPVPPYSLGNGSPRMSCSARIRRMSHGYSACSSISAERGAIFSRAIWPMERIVVPPTLRTRSATSSVIAKICSDCSSSIR